MERFYAALVWLALSLIPLPAAPDLWSRALGLASPMLTDEEADAIRKGLAEGYRGPVLLKWLEQLLEDREERRRQEREREEAEKP